MKANGQKATAMDGRPITLRNLLAAFAPQICVTWGTILIEVALFALIPLLIGRAIDGLLTNDLTPFWTLFAIMAALIFVATLRRVYDTRAFGIMRVELGKTLAKRSQNLPVTQLNARLDMGHELVYFLETEAPESMTAIARTLAAAAILATFSPILTLACVVGLILVFAIYWQSHGRFFRLNAALNHRLERQIDVLSTRSLPRLGAHLLGLRKSQIRISDTEAIVYGLIFFVLVGLLLFNLWFATREIAITAGTVFSIVTYSWDFVEGALMLPITLQTLSRLSEITQRINPEKET